MLNTVDTATMTFQEQSTQATRDLCAKLGLDTVSPSQLKYLTLALMRIATEEAGRSSDFAERVRSLYLALLPARSNRRDADADRVSSRRGNGPNRIKLIPVGSVDEALLDPYAPPNPFVLQQLYGNEQLSLALERYTLTKLKEAVAVVQERFPGTKPKRMTKPGIVEYIVSAVTGVSGE